MSKLSIRDPTWATQVHSLRSLGCILLDKKVFLIFLCKKWVAANVFKELYFYADVGNETYDIRDFHEPKPIVWDGESDFSIERA